MSFSSKTIAHWKMNDNAASATVIDAMGLYNGTYTSAGGSANTADNDVAGKVNNALDFVGDDDYIVVTDAAVFSPVLTPFSVSAWVYMHDATLFAIASKGVSATDGEWRFHTDSLDRPAIYQWDESIDKYIERVCTTTAAENQWVHLVGTSDGGTSVDGLKIYSNGVRVDNHSYYSGSFAGTENLSHDVWIGRYNNDYANGVIDNLMYFNVELSADEVKRIYNNGHGTEILAEIDENVLPRRGTSPHGLRRRYEFA